MGAKPVLMGATHNEATADSLERIVPVLADSLEANTLQADSALNLAAVTEPGDSTAVALTDRQRRRHRMSADTVAAKPTGRRISRVKTDLDNTVEIVAKDSMVLIVRT